MAHPTSALLLYQVRKEIAAASPATRSHTTGIPACSNGLIEESRLEMDADNNLIIYYKANEDGIAAINKYIPN